MGSVDLDSLADVERRRLSERSKIHYDSAENDSQFEVSGMAPPLKETARGNLQFAGAVDVDHVVRRRVEPVSGVPEAEGIPGKRHNDTKMARLEFVAFVEGSHRCPDLMCAATRRP